MSDIAYVEQFVSSKLATTLKDVEEEVKVHFFGQYSNTPTEFTFNRGEKRLIIRIKEPVSVNGLKHFEVKNDDRLWLMEMAKSELCDTPIGFLFKELLSPIDLRFIPVESEFIDLSEYENIINAELKSSQTQTTESLLVNDNSAFGIRLCPQSELSSSIEPLLAESKDINKYEIDKQMSHYANTFYTQLYVQNIRNKSCATFHKEQLENFIVDVKSRKNSIPLVKICAILGDGNYLFSALVHQLFNVSVNSAEHKLEIIKLRQRVTEHILSNINSFQRYLIDRMLADSEFEIDISNMEMSCAKFVNQKLTQHGYWGGTETLKAVAEIHFTNILIVNDDGTSNLGNCFNPKYNKSMIISFKSSNKRLKKRDHNDSVAEISDSLLSKFSQNAIEKISS